MYIRTRVVEKRHKYYFEKGHEITLISLGPNNNPIRPVIILFVTKSQALVSPWAVQAEHMPNQPKPGHNALQSERRAVDKGFFQHRMEKGLLGQGCREEE